MSGALFGNMFVFDRMALFFKMFIVGATILVILASIDYVQRFRFFRGEYYFLVVMSALGMMFMASANDLLSLFVTLEFSTFGFYVLVAYLRDDLASNEAGLKFFILGVFAAGLLAYGISLVYGETGKLVFSDMAHATATPGLMIGFLLIFAALGFKIGAVPFHSWIPDTYHGAPTPVTAFLSIAPKGAAFAILLRMFFVALATFKPMWVFLLVGSVDSIHDLWQHRRDRAAKHQATACLFGNRADRQYPDRAGRRNQNGKRRHSVLPADLSVCESRRLCGRYRRQPARSAAMRSTTTAASTAAPRFWRFAMLMFLLSLAGVPPLAGFIGKLYIFVAAIKEGLYTLITVGLINIVISMYYYLIVVKKMYINEPIDPSPLSVSGPMKAVIYVGLAGTLLIGIYPQPFIDWVVSATLMFSNLPVPSAVVLPPTPPSGG